MFYNDFNKSEYAKKLSADNQTVRYTTMYTIVDSHLPDGNNQLSSPKKCWVKSNVDANRHIGNCSMALKTTRVVFTQER